MTYLRALIARYRDALISARNVAGFTFAGMFGSSLLGWLGQLGEWASSSGASPFPSTSVLGYAFVAAGTAAATGALAGLVRAVQSATGRGNPPTYS